MNLADILKIVQQLIDLEKKAEEAIADEKDRVRRKRLASAIAGRDLDAIRHILFDVN